MRLRDLVTPLLRPKTRKENGLDVKSSAAGPVLAFSHIGRPKWTPRRYDALIEEGYRKNVVAYRCATMIASAAASVPWVLYDADGDEVDEHPMLNMLACPNPSQDGITFREALFVNLETAGNAYVEAVKPDDEAYPTELYLLRPDRTKVIPSEVGLPMGFSYEANGRAMRWYADPVTGRSTVLHVKHINPLDDWYGMAPLEAAMVSVDQHNAAGAWNAALLAHGARPSGALVYAPKEGPAALSEEQLARLRDEMDQHFAGRRNAGRPLILEGGLEWKEMSLSPQEMDWQAGRDAAARDIALAFGVPAQLIGIAGAQTYANMAEARLALYEETVLPLLARVIAAVNQWLPPLFEEEGMHFAYDADAVSALTARRDALWEKLQKVDFLTADEKRAAVGYGASI